MEILGPGTELTSNPNSLSYLVMATFDFYGVTIQLKSNVDEVVSRFRKAYEFFLRPDISQPHLEINFLVGEGGPADVESRVIRAQFPASFDFWEGSLIRWLGPDSEVGQMIKASIVRVEPLPGQGQSGYRYCQIGKVETWSGDWYAGLEILVFCFVMFHFPNLFPLHAAVVSKNGQGLLFCGTTGSGKSTLSYSLARCGYRFLSDEYAILDPNSLEVLPFPRGINFKSGAIELFPEIKALLQNKDMPLSLEDLGLETDGKPAKASFLFFVKHEAGAAPQLRRMANSEAIETLEEGLNLMVLSPLESRTITRPDAAAALGNGAQCYELLSGDLEKTVELIDSLTAD